MSQYKTPTSTARTLTLTSQELDGHRLRSQLGKVPAGRLPLGMLADRAVLVDQQFVRDHQRLCSLLASVLCRIVNSYFQDERIRRIFGLDPSWRTCCESRAADRIVWGCFRPDFLVDQTGQSRICEIGCRFPANGWMISLYVQSALAAMVDSDVQQLTNAMDLATVISFFEETFDLEEPVFLVRENEKGMRFICW